jgi:hypothetical protein
MATTHINFNDQINHGRDLRRCLQQMEESHQGLNDLLLVMAQMLDGDGSQAAHFTYITSKFGFDSDAKAKAAYEELNSLASKFNTDASVSSVRAAMAQAFARFG